MKTAGLFFVFLLPILNVPAAIYFLNHLTFALSCTIVNLCMSDAIKHECGLAFIRLRKPFSYYQQQYGTVMWGINKLYLLMEKQHNRGQDGAGVAAVKLNVEPGYPFLQRIRSSAPQPIVDIFSKINNEVKELEKYQNDIAKHPGLMICLGGLHQDWIFVWFSPYGYSRTYHLYYVSLRFGVSIKRKYLCKLKK